MASEQPETLSQGAQPPDAGSPAEPSTQTDETPSKSPTWWQRITRHTSFGRDEPPVDEEAQAAEQTSQPLALTQEELERKVQAETDRREAKRQAEARAAERRRLRDEDPWAFAEQERKAEQQAEGGQQLETFVASIGVAHDRITIDPLMDAVSQDERERILKLDGAGVGVDGRRLIVGEALKALEKKWKAEGAKDAEARLRRNQSFRKQVLAESRDGTVEPELLPGASGGSTDQTVSTLLRDYYHLPGPREHNTLG